METNNYTTAKYTVAIDVAKSPDRVFSHLINDVSKWWQEEIEGECSKLNDEFIFRSGDSHYSKNKVIEFVPNKKVVWLVTESLRKTDSYEWTGTKMIFELTSEGDRTVLTFTYDGIVLENEQESLVQICDFCIKDKLYNSIESYKATIEVTNSPGEIFQRITNDVAKWWGGKDYSGGSTNPNDEFIVNHPGAHYSKQRLVEVIPGKTVVWLVTESKLSWLKNQEEWTNTKMVFEISAKSYSCLLHFSHEGLVPEKECYARCCEGWNMVIKDWLYTLIMYGKAHF